MSRNDSAPTLGWVIMSKFYKLLAFILIIIIVVIGAGVTVLYKTLDDCKPLGRDINVFNYVVHVQASKSCGSST